MHIPIINGVPFLRPFSNLTNHSTKLVSILPHHSDWNLYVNMMSYYLQNHFPQALNNKKIEVFKKELNLYLTRISSEKERGLFFFEKNSEYIGLSNVYLDSGLGKPKTLNVAEFYIIPPARRQRAGTGCFEQLKAWGKQKGAQEVSVEVDIENKTANQFWRQQELGLKTTSSRNIYTALL